MKIDRHKGMFSERGVDDLFSEIATHYSALLTRRQKSQSVAKTLSDYGNPRRIRDSVYIYRQVLLYRAILLYEGALSSAAEENVYSMTLAIRGLFETVGALGYVHYRLDAMQKKNISLVDFDKGLTEQVMGSRDKKLVDKDGAPAPDPKHVLRMLRHADKTVNKHLLGPGEALPILVERYEWLSEFCHPNFHSNCAAMDVEKSVPEFQFRFDAPMRKEEFILIGNLRIAAPIFVELFDQLPALLPPLG